MSNCTNCNKKIGLFQKKFNHIDELGNSKLLCKSCNKILRLKIITPLIKKYFDKCEVSEKAGISNIYTNKDFFELVQPHNLFNLKCHIEEHQSFVNDNVNKGDYDDLDSSMQLMEIYKFQLIFLVDLEKILKLLNKKNITTDYPELLELFNDLVLEQMNQETKLTLDEEHLRISEVLSSDISVRKVIKEFIKTPSDVDFDKDIIMKLLERFNLNFREHNIDELINELYEEIELEEFENDLVGNSKNTLLSDPSNLSGLEFETFLKQLFEILGYTVIKTKSSGDQGADLILKFNSIKTVVQAKRYSGNVSNKAVQEVAAARKHYKCDNAMVVTTGKFTKSAIQLAISNEVELWDSEKLSRKISQINSSTYSMTNKYEELDNIFETIKDEYYSSCNNNGSIEAQLHNAKLLEILLIRLGDELSEVANEILAGDETKNEEELLQYGQELVSKFEAIIQGEIDSFLEREL